MTFLGLQVETMVTWARVGGGAGWCVQRPLCVSAVGQRLFLQPVFTVVHDNLV